MAEINHKNSKIMKGVLGVGSGEVQVLQLVRNGVIKGISEPIKIKRPNQYL